MILKRCSPPERRATVERTWEGRTVVCAATGPSLIAEQIAAVKASGYPLIVVNDAYLMAPFADVAYFADVKWWKWHKDRPEWKAFAGQKCTISMGGSEASDPEILTLENAKQGGLSTDPRAICTGSNSGYQAINIATLAGAKRIVLIGYDGQPSGGRNHYFGDHPDKSAPPYDAIRIRFRELVAPTKALGIRIIQASPGSRIDCFEKASLAESLQPDPQPAVVPA